MPVCVACGVWGIGPLCLDCRRQLGPGGSLLIDEVPGRYALHHSGTGRRLVHQLKYHGVVGAAQVLAALMAPLIPGHGEMLVPIPRATVRRMVFGVDPAWELAQRIGHISGLPVVKALLPPLWWPRNAGTPSGRRAVPGFRARLSPRHWVLIDDVITSGATVRGAIRALGSPVPGEIASVIAATSPGMMVASKAPIASGRLRDGTAAGQNKVDYRP